MIKYRPDIDGLRALAVLPVVLFHANIPWLSGGYVGVDVFFVISGYLITSLVQREVTQERFSIARFYERRARRLMPALFVVIALTSALAAWVLVPNMFKNYAQSVGATAMFASNFLFWREAGYFDAPAEGKPLLHTWSLAVEEQFYLFYPLVLILAHRYLGKRTVPIIVGLTLASFGANIGVIGTHQSAAFYLLPFRAWELGVGALLALGVGPKNPGRGLALAMGGAGTLMILVAIATYSAATPFPGYAAALPCLGAGLIIAAGQTPGGFVYDGFASKPMVFVGKISYSLYLWHWPVIVFTRFFAPDGELTPALVAFVVVVSMVGATLSYWFVEQPFRRNDFLTRKTVFAAVAAVIALWMGFAGAGHLSGGLPQRMSADALRFGAASEDFTPQAPVCGAFDEDPELCVIGATGQAPSFMMWGDSHAGILVNGVHKAAADAGAAGLFSGIAGCPALIGVAKDESVADTATDQDCTTRNQAILEVLRRHPEIESILLVGRWAYYAQGGGFGVDAHDTIDLWDAKSGEGKGRENNGPLFEAKMRHTIETLAGMGRRVYVLQQVPEFPRYTAARMAREYIVGGEVSAQTFADMTRVPRPDVGERQAHMERVLANLPRGATALPTWDRFCDDTHCDVMDGETPRYFDSNHVTTSTAIGLAPVFGPVVGGG